MDNLKEWYNGYCFSGNKSSIHNPFSILLYMQSGILEPYSFEANAPQSLLVVLKNDLPLIQEIATDSCMLSSLAPCQIDAFQLEKLLFQAGYLSIKDFDPETDVYHLKQPNKEAALSLAHEILTAFSRLNAAEISSIFDRMREALEEHTMYDFFSQLHFFCMHIDYPVNMPREQFYCILFHFIGTMLGMTMHSEVTTDAKKIDLTLITKKDIYIVEFRFNTTAQEVLQHIDQKKYYEKYVHTGKPITLLGVSFNYSPKIALEIDYTFKKHNDT